MVAGVVVGEAVSDEAYLAFGSGGDFAEVVVEEHDVGAVHGSSDGECAVGEDVAAVAAVVSDADGCLGGAVGIVDGHLLEEMADGGGVERTAAADEEADGDGEGIDGVEFHHQEGEAADDGDILLVDETDEELGVVAGAGRGYGYGRAAEDGAEYFLNEDVHDAGRELEENVVARDVVCALERLGEVEHLAVAHGDSEGESVGGGGVENVGGAVGARAVGQRMESRVDVDIGADYEAAETVEHVGVMLLGYHEVYAVFNEERDQTPRREIGLDSHESGSGFDYGHHCGYHLDAVVHDDADSGRDERGKTGDKCVDQTVETCIGDAGTLVDDGRMIRVIVDELFEA